MGAGIGWVGPLMRAGLIQCALNLFLSFVLVLLWGYVGVLVGTMVALILSTGYIFVCFCRDFNRSIGQHLRLLARILLVNLPSTIVSLLYLLWAADWVVEGGRGPAFVVFLGCVMLYGTVYLSTICFSRILDRLDWELLGDYLPAVRRFVRESNISEV